MGFRIIQATEDAPYHHRETSTVETNATVVTRDGKFFATWNQLEEKLSKPTISILENMLEAVEECGRDQTKIDLRKFLNIR